MWSRCSSYEIQMNSDAISMPFRCKSYVTYMQHGCNLDAMQMQLIWNLDATEMQLRNGFKIKKLRNFGHMSKLGVPYLPSSLVWTKISLDKYSYCLPYLPIQKVWTFSNLSLFLNVHFLTLVRILLVDIQVEYYQGHL